MKVLQGTYSEVHTSDKCANFYRQHRMLDIGEGLTYVNVEPIINKELHKRLWEHNSNEQNCKLLLIGYLLCYSCAADYFL